MLFMTVKKEPVPLAANPLTTQVLFLHKIYHKIYSETNDLSEIKLKELDAKEKALVLRL